jgi:hypothetical protein
MRTHSTPKMADWEQLSTIFLTSTDGKLIFPKLPQMLKAHFGKWIMNQDIKILGEQIRDGCNPPRLDLKNGR